MEQTNLDEIIAKNVAIEFVNQKYNPLNSNGRLSSYFVVVGEDHNHSPNSIYAENLLNNELDAISNKDATNVFFTKEDYDSEFLIRVYPDIKNHQLMATVLYTPSKG